MYFGICHLILFYTGSFSSMIIGSGFNPRFFIACSLKSLFISFWIFISVSASGDGFGFTCVAIAGEHENLSSV